MALALGGCGVAPVTPSPSDRALVSPSPVASGPRPTPRTTPPLGTITPFDGQTLTDGNRLLTLQFVGGRVFSVLDHCFRAYTAWAELVGDHLEVGVVDVTPPRLLEDGATPPACDAVGISRTVSTRLPEPFLGSRIHDLSGYTHFIRRPDGLVELRGLPATWVLRSERDVEESPTGRWQRTYSPVANPDVGTSRDKIDFYQAFGGPAGVSGGQEQRTVSVNGRNALLYRFAPDGELVLVWDLGSDGLALVVNERDFPVERLISLAESAIGS